MQDLRVDLSDESNPKGGARMKCDILLCGVGGQGTVLASKILSQAAVDEGLFVRSAETIGMAQRGGAVVSHVRIGDSVYSPLIEPGHADVLLAFEPGEAARNLRFLRPGGLLVVSDKGIMPVTASLGRSGYDPEVTLRFLREKANPVILCADSVFEEVGSTKVLNVALIGAAGRAGALGFARETLLGAMEKRIPERFMALNKRAFEAGEHLAIPSREGR